MIWVLKPLLWLLTRIGFVRRSLGVSVGGRFGAIYGCQHRREYEKAADLAIDALKEFRHQQPGVGSFGATEFWWHFMRAAVANLEKFDDRDKREDVIALARDGVEPFEGYDVAYSFLVFAKWRYAQRDFDAVIEFATVASKADATWAEPDFFMGWFCLATGRGDALAHLSLAVDKDPGILSRIVNDPLCRRHPHLIEGLRNISADDLVSGSDGPD